jgi:hypothetical protein
MPKQTGFIDCARKCPGLRLFAARVSWAKTLAEADSPNFL